ncbi:MAG: hypothetical protein KKE11_00355 [Gammaproteobacteria bacterium]|nr:hypothetical protein [Gammaproteobacteria bacterium]
MKNYKKIYLTKKEIATVYGLGKCKCLKDNISTYTQDLTSIIENQVFKTNVATLQSAKDIFVCMSRCCDQYQSKSWTYYGEHGVNYSNCPSDP